MGLTLNGGYGGGGGSYPTLEVTITNGSAASVTATLGSTVVNLTYDSGVWRGTLKAFGTWTVEASNGEKTVSDTVDVTNVAVYTTSLQFSPLPSGYTELEYIESTGTQYINTGFYPISANILGGKFALTRTDVDYIIFSARKSGNSIIIELRYHYGSPKPGYSDELIYYSSATPTWADTLLSDTSVHEFETNGKTGSSDRGITIDGSFYTVGGSPAVTSNNDTPMNLLGGYVRMYRFYAYATDGTTLVRDMYPARRNSDSVLGMWDNVTQTFYTNAGSGSFTAGPEV